MSETSTTEQTSEAYPTQEYDDGTYALNHPENSVPEQVSAPQPSSRTFYRSDYGRAARMLQAARHVPGDPYTAKPEAQEDTVAALAFMLVQAFEADSPRFDAGKFMDATQLPVKPQVIEPDPEENEGEAEMAALADFIDPE